MVDWEARPTLVQLTSLEGRVAVVTGAAQGFGFACADRLAEAGARVLLADTNAERLSEAADVLQQRGPGATYQLTDVTDPGSVDGMIGAAIRSYGQVDILVNNAGVRSNVLLERMTPERFTHLIDVGVLGTFLCTRAAAAVMRKNERGGSIINVTSIDAIHPSAPGLSHHAATKHGIWGFTKAMALELGPHGIRVNAIAPGPSLTEGAREYVEAGTPDGIDMARHWEAYASRIPLRRLLSADEIGRAAVFLASDLASFVNGAQLVVDGGLLVA
jgi:2-deoxy-D-gluconate 3-dehydrogenase